MRIQALRGGQLVEGGSGAEWLWVMKEGIPGSGSNHV